MPKAHRCERFDQPWRGKKRCRSCGKLWYSVSRTEWRPTMPLRQFAEKWLPAVSGTEPRDMMRVDVAFPFEWNCYESWNTVFRVTFDFTGNALETRTDVLDGWQSKYHEDFCRIDYEAEQVYAERTGRKYNIGDNSYDEMRRIIQA